MGAMVSGIRFRVQGSGFSFSVQGLGFRGLGFRGWGLELMVLGRGLKVLGSRLRVYSSSPTSLPADCGGGSCSLHQPCEAAQIKA